MTSEGIVPGSAGDSPLVLSCVLSVSKGLSKDDFEGERMAARPRWK